MLKIDKEKAILLLTKYKNKIDNIKGLPRFDAQFVKWKRDTEVTLENIFGSDSRHLIYFNNISYQLTSYPVNMPETKHIAIYNRGLDEAKAILESIIEEIENFYIENDKKVIPTIINSNHETSNRIFIVHGHDKEMEQSVARYIEKLELDPIILHEKPNQGKTIIEKFEEYSDVGFAIVLLSPDDICYSTSKSDIKKSRSRQNVIFELGFFIGKLSRENVIALYKKADDFEWPSDYSGVIYIEFDEVDNWRHSVMKELKSAGYKIDANRLY